MTQFVEDISNDEMLDDFQPEITPNKQEPINKSKNNQTRSQEPTSSKKSSNRKKKANGL